MHSFPKSPIARPTVATGNCCPCVTRFWQLPAGGPRRIAC